MGEEEIGERVARQGNCKYSTSNTKSSRTPTGQALALTPLEPLRGEQGF